MSENDMYRRAQRARLCLSMVGLLAMAACRSWQPVADLGPIASGEDRIRVTTSDKVVESDLYDVRGDTLVVFTPLWVSGGRGEPSGEILRVGQRDIASLERHLPDYTHTAIAAIAVLLAVTLGLTDLVTGPNGG